MTSPPPPPHLLLAAHGVAVATGTAPVLTGTELVHRFAATTALAGRSRRGAVARALVATPSVVFADEPTGALDRQSGEQTMRLLVAATRERGAALVVTHDVEVAAHCDRLVEVRDGHLSAPAPPTAAAGRS